MPDLDSALKIGEEFGYPVIIKATAGGGGKGMKVANNAEEMKVAFSTARAEGKANFGNDEVYIEKYLTTPRHIEIQVFGDGKGNAVHLGSVIAHCNAGTKKCSKRHRARVSHLSCAQRSVRSAQTPSPRSTISVQAQSNSCSRMTNSTSSK